MKIVPSLTWNDRMIIIYEHESIWISYQEYDKMAK